MNPAVSGISNEAERLGALMMSCAPYLIMGMELRMRRNVDGGENKKVLFYVIVFNMILTVNTKNI
jgi:hypothetical protein